MLNRIFNTFVGTAFLAIYFIGHYEFTQLIPTIISINFLCIAFGFYVGKVNKKQISKIIISVRIGVSVKTIIPLFLTLGAYIAFEYLLDYHMDLSEKESPFIYSAPLIIAMYFGMKHQNIINSLRVYQNGIRLPGPLAKTNSWQTIQTVSRNKDLAIIQINNKIKNVKILKNDLTIFDEITEIHKKVSAKQAI